MRQIVLDTETTGLDVALGHKIIEIGCIEVINRKITGNRLHFYINPEREVEAGAIEVHGITNEMLADERVFGEIAGHFIEFVQGAELIIHNAPFDIGFLNQELASLQRGFLPMNDYCQVLDTLALARKKHPGQKNSLDALCKRYQVDNSQRELHGALKDAEILADVYLLMTGGQSSLVLGYEAIEQTAASMLEEKVSMDRRPLRVVLPSEEELVAHRARLQQIQKNSGNKCLWLMLDAPNPSP